MLPYQMIAGPERFKNGFILQYNFPRVKNYIRKEANISACWELDTILTNMKAILVYVKPTDIEWSSEQAGMNLEKLNEMFEKVTKISLLDTIVTDFDNIDDAFSKIIFNAFKYDFYFASPFFNDEQVEREERMIEHLRNQGFRVFSPKENCLLDSKASFSSRDEVFKSNCDAINNSVGVFAVTDGKDMGTIWEAGYAYGIKKPVIYYAETLGDNKFNLMLAQSGRDVYTSQKEVTFGSLIDSLHGVRRKFRGDIE